MMYHALRGVRGLGDCAADDSGCVDTSSNPFAGSTASGGMPTPGADYTDTVTGQLINGATGQPYQTSTPSGSPSSGFNWGIFAPLINAAGAIGSGFAASQLQPGQSLQTSGTTIVGAGQALPGMTIAGVNLTSMMPMLLLAGGGLILVMVMSGGGRR